MEWLVNNWYLLIAAVAVLGVAGWFIWYIIKMPKEKRWARVLEWLHFAVVEAEKELGSQTGQLKLVKVYDMFISKFPFVSLIMPYNTFKDLVDKALDWMRKIIEENQKISAYVVGELPAAETPAPADGGRVSSVMLMETK